MLDVCPLPIQPRRLWRLIAISAAINDPGYVIAKFFADIAQSFCATAIFHRIMKKCADRFSLIPAVLKRDGSDTKNMRDVRNPCFLAHLITMRLRRINQRFLKFFRQLHLLEAIVCDMDGQTIAAASCAFEITFSASGARSVVRCRAKEPAR